ncbi:hypothetical protein [Methanopyrus sp.]
MIRCVVTVLVVASLLVAPVTAQSEGATTGGTGQATPTVQPSQPAPGGSTTTTTGGGGYTGVSESQPSPATGKEQQVGGAGEKTGGGGKKGGKGGKKSGGKHAQRTGLQGLTRPLRELRYYALATAVGLTIMAVMMGYGLVKFERRLSQRSTKVGERGTGESRKPPRVERKLRKREPEEEEVEKVRRLWKQVKEGE